MLLLPAAIEYRSGNIVSRQIEFSVIVPTYNRTDLLSLTIASLREQTFTHFEVVLVDDGSTDARVSQIMDEAAAADLRFTTVKLPINQGLPGARNAGIARAKGDYIAFLDSDDCYLPWCLERFSEAIAQTNQPAFLAAKVCAIDGLATTFTAKNEPLSIQIYRDYFSYRSTVAKWWFPPSATAVRADVLRSAGGFWSGRDYSEDADLWLRLGTAQGFVFITAPACSGYRLHGSSMHTAHRKMADGSLRIIRREKTGEYPDIGERRKERIATLCRQTRHRSLELWKHGFFRLGMQIYLQTFFWNLRFQGIRYVLAGPAYGAYRALVVRN